MLVGSAAAAAQQREAAAHGSMLWDYIVGSIRRLDETRRVKLASLKSVEELEEVQRYVRAKLADMWGPFPERTPLNAKRVGQIDRPGYVIEKIIFESRPRFYVTANLYRPERAAGRLPAVIFPPGHYDQGKSAEAYQRFCILMAREGFVALTWDPVGQGERLQLYDPKTGEARAGRGTSEHKALGNQCYLIGLNLMNYRAWDAVRAIDYLETRTDVDRARIACVGQSGGGMETLQFAPYETRLAAAVPVCAVATFRGKTEALLIADAEQILHGTLAAGIDHPELLATVAPRPLLIGSAIRDYVPIAFARSTYDELKPVYGLLGRRENLAMAETDAGHSLNQELREAIASFLHRRLGGQERQVREADAPVCTDRELWCTESGQVAASFPGETVLTLNQVRAARLANLRTIPSAAGDPERFRTEVAKRIRAVTKVDPVRAEEGIVAPVRRFGGSGSKSTLLVIAEQGKDDPALERSMMRPLVDAGWRVVAMDARGWGATTPSMPDREKRPDGKPVKIPWDDFFAYRSIELGRPLFGQRLRDVLVAAAELPGPISILGTGAGALLAAHAAVLEPRIANAVSIGGLLSYRLLIEDPLQRHPTSLLLPDVLASYDVPQVYGAIAGRRLLVLNPRDSRRAVATGELAAAELEPARRAFEAARNLNGFSLRTGVAQSELGVAVAQWLVAGPLQ
jgi:dienelactone hydrolase